MKTILFHARSFEAFWAHYSFINDIVFIERLKELGYNLVLSSKGTVEQADWILFNEATSIGSQRLGLVNRLKYNVNLLLGRDSPLENDVYGECEKKNLLHKTALLVMEGPVGLPENHGSAIKKRFPKIMTWNDSQVDGKQVQKFNWPVPVEWNVTIPLPFNEKKLFVNISANKYSSHELELYSDRRELITFLEKNYAENFDLYGIGWNEAATRWQRILKKTVPHYTSYRGKIGNKAEAFAKYRFALCYENSCVPGWITEKIFDCMRSNCIPIYLGAPNILDFVDENAFIDKRKFKSTSEMFRYLAEMKEDEYNVRLAAMHDYLDSDRFKRFLTTSFAERILEILESKIEVNI